MNKKRRLIKLIRALFVLWTGMLMLGMGFVVFKVVVDVTADVLLGSAVLYTIVIWSAVVVSKGIRLFKEVERSKEGGKVDE